MKNNECQCNVLFILCANEPKTHDGEPFLGLRYGGTVGLGVACWPSVILIFYQKLRY